MRTLPTVLAIAITWAASGAAALAQTQPASRPAAATVFCLDATYRPESALPRQSLLVREVVRQAVLIAAREELGLSTRDAVLREPFPPGARVFEVEVKTGAQGEFHAELLERGPGAKPQPLWRRSVPMKGRYPDLLPAVVSMTDRALFTDIAKGLTDAGFTPAPARRADGLADAGLPAGTEERLAELNCFPQFAALRQLHAAARDGGESPAVLGGLVRAYANLGQLTQLQWNVAHLAFKARALLYAQRLMAAQPDEPGPLWHRAYAWTMAGLHAQALTDLARADARAKAKRIEPPPWVALIDAAARYDTRALFHAFGDDRDEPFAPLASYLCFLTIENGRNIDILMKFGDVARQLNPACVRLIDAMTESGGVGMQHQTTMEAAEVFKGAIFRDLPKIPDLPQSVRDALTEAQKLANVPRSRADIAAAVVEAGDPSRDTAEPSWAILGRVMQDTYFAQTHRRVYFMTFMWSLDKREVAAFVEQAKTLIGDHPYTPVLEAYGTWNERPRALGLLNGMALRDVNWTMFPFILQTVKGREASAGEPTLWKLLLANQDDTAVDLERLIRHYYEWHTPYKTQVARVLNAVSPHSPVGVATLIEGDWEQSQPKVAQWERDHANHPAVAAALARQYTKLNKLADAKRMWETALEVSPDIHSYAALAAIHLQEGNEDEWLATLERALQAEDYGLDHAGVRVQIADHLMAKGDYRRALPYADDAAETWAEWAMWCAVRCHQGLRDWKNAELWVQRISERYEASADNWMMWCLRSGHGDLKAATQLARAAAKRAGSGREALVNRGAFELLTGNAAAAEAPLAESMERYGDAWAGLHVAVLRHDAKDFAGRDAALNVCVERGSELRVNDRQRPELVELARLAQRALAQPGGKIDAGKLDAALRNVPAEERANGEYFAARFFQALGQEKEANDYLLRAANCPDIARTNAVLAIIELRKRGIEVSPATAPATQPTR